MPQDPRDPRSPLTPPISDDPWAPRPPTPPAPPSGTEPRPGAPSADAPWFGRAERRIPEPLPEVRVREQVLAICQEAKDFRLATQCDERDLTEAGAVRTRWHEGVLKAVQRSAEQHPGKFDPEALALFKRLHKEDALLGDLENAHSTSLRYYRNSRTLRREAIWKTAERLMEPLRALVEEGLRTGTVDAEALAAWMIIDGARKQAIEASEDSRDKVQRAYDKGARTEKERVDYLTEQLELARAQLAQSQAQVQDLLREKNLENARRISR
jgi:hypothetical protein